AARPSLSSAPGSARRSAAGPTRSTHKGLAQRTARGNAAGLYERGNRSCDTLSQVGRRLGALRHAPKRNCPAAPQDAATRLVAQLRLHSLHNLCSTCGPQVDFLDTTSCVQHFARLALPEIRDDFRSLMQPYVFIQ